VSTIPRELVSKSVS